MTDTIREPFLWIEGLTKAFPDNGSRTARKTLFRDLSLTIDTNQIVGILGHSGSGKSTLLNLIAGLDTPDAGEICVNGRRVTRPGSDRMVIFQHYARLPWLTIADNVRLAVDETMRDRILLLQAGEQGTISRDLDVGFPHPRDRAALRRDEAFHALRNEIMGELERSFVLHT